MGREGGVGGPGSSRPTTKVASFKPPYNARRTRGATVPDSRKFLWVNPFQACAMRCRLVRAARYLLRTNRDSPLDELGVRAAGAVLSCCASARRLPGCGRGGALDTRPSPEETEDRHRPGHGLPAVRHPTTIKKNQWHLLVLLPCLAWAPLLWGGGLCTPDRSPIRH